MITREDVRAGWWFPTKPRLGPGVRSQHRDALLCFRVLNQARPYWRHMAGILLLDVIATPLMLLTPLPLKIAVDSVVGNQPLTGPLRWLLPGDGAGSNVRLLTMVAVLQVLIVLLVQLQNLGSHALRTYTGEQLTLRSRTRLFQHLQNLSLTYHDSKGLADSVYRIQYDAMCFQQIAVDGILMFISSSVTIAAMVYVTLRINWQLALVALGVCPPMILLIRSYRKRIRSGHHAAKELDTHALKVVQEALGALRLVKAFGREGAEETRFLMRSSEGVRTRIQLAIAEGAFGLLIGLVSAVGVAAVLFVGVLNVEAGTLTLGALLIVISYLAQLYSPLKTISKKVAAMQSALVSAERVFELLDLAPQIQDRPGARPLIRAEGAIRFRDVSFSYDAERPILRELSFFVPADTCLGIRGRTGVGKTTLVNLVARFHDPKSGSILLDGIDLRDYRLRDLRNQLSIVLQDALLFSVTIAENIVYGRPDATPEEIERAARAANAHDFIMDLPNGYDTLVGERGMRLSGGERQRIALARAFLKDAPILILDEPTSAVDTKTESAIMDAMTRLIRGRTTLLITHRPSLLKCCDARLDLENTRYTDGYDARSKGSEEPATSSSDLYRVDWP
ncbi:MAG: ABC transporter ATP-binding protein [Actinomycetota bacterium]